MENLRINIKVSEDTFLKDPNSTVLGKQILTYSIQLIDDLGFEAFTFKKLGLKIGSPESSIYRYFESKHMLLIYLTNWYWSWMEYKMVFAIMNIESAKKKLIRAIEILIQPIKEDTSITHIDEVLLNQLIINEGMKAYHIKQVDEENEKGYFNSYKSIIKRVGDLLLDVIPNYKYSKMLITTIVEGAHQQKYFSKHLPTLTDNIDDKQIITKFYTELLTNILVNNKSKK